MSTLVLDRPRHLVDVLEHDEPRLATSALFSGTTEAHGAITLDDLITGAWQGLAARETVSCPVCGGGMAPRTLVDSNEPPSAACLSCGSELA